MYRYIQHKDKSYSKVRDRMHSLLNWSWCYAVGLCYHICFVSLYAADVKISQMYSSLLCSIITFLCCHFAIMLEHTVDRKNFAVKIISRSKSTAKIKHAKNKIMRRWSLNKLACARVHTPWGKCPIDDYSERFLALLMPIRQELSKCSSILQ